MADIDIGRTGEGGVAFGADTQGEASIAKTFSYCCECGSWGAHAAKCVSCGYDFYADPIDGIQTD